MRTILYTEPHWAASALITIDTQNDFALPGAPAEIPGTAAVLPAMARLLAAYRANGLPIVHVVRLYQADGSNVDLCRRSLIENGARIVAPGSSGAELAEALLPAGGSSGLDADSLLLGELQSIGEREWVAYKPRWGAFYRTRLDAFLRESGAGTVVFAGCNFPNCPRASMYEASERDYRVVMVSDAMSQVYEKGVQEVSAIGVNVHTADEVLAALSRIG